MKIEDIPRVRLAARRTAQQQGHLPIRDGLLGEVVVDAQCVLGRLPLLALPHEVLGHRAARVGGEVLHGGGVGGGGVDDDGVVEGAVLFECFNDARDGRFLLTDGDIDAHHGVGSSPVVLLVDDRVDGDGGLAGLAVADDELALPPPDRDHRVDRLDPGLERLGDWLPLGDSGGDDVDEAHGLGVDGGPAVDGLSEGVDDAAEERFADGDGEETACGGDGVAFLDGEVVAVNDGADGVEFEVEDLSHDGTVGGLELEHFAGHGVGQAVDPGDAVAHLDHAPDIRDLERRGVLLNFVLDDTGDFVGLDLHGGCSACVVCGDCASDWAVGPGGRVVRVCPRQWSRTGRGPRPIRSR